MEKVLLVEDFPRGNSGLADFLAKDPDILVVGATGDHEQAIQAIARSRPDLVVLHLSPMLLAGAEVTRQIMENHPKSTRGTSSRVCSPAWVETARQNLNCCAIAAR